MPKLYVKNGASLVPVSEDKVRNYESLECVAAAIADGCLKPGDLYTTICKTEAICDDLAATIYQILSYIPDTTNATDNKLLNHCDMGTALTDIDCAKCDIADLQTCVTNLNSCKVECSDYQTCCTAWDTSITNLCSCAGLNCTGTLVPSDLNTINTCIACLKSCPGLDCTGNVSKSQVNAMFSLSGTTLTITSVS